jgi:hypothetical protein
MEFNNKITNHLRNGGKVRRKCWGKDCFILVKADPNSHTVDFNNQNQNRYSLSAEAVLATDWETINE